MTRYYRKIETRDEVLNDMWVAKTLFMTKGGRWCSPSTDEYLREMSKYSQFCKEEEKDFWTKRIYKIIISVGEPEYKDSVLSKFLHAYENAGEIMEHLANGESWSEIREIVYNQRHTNVTFALLGKVLLKHSPFGIEFVEQMSTFAETGRLCFLRSLIEEYEKEKIESSKKDKGKRKNVYHNS